MHKNQNTYIKVTIGVLTVSSMSAASASWFVNFFGLFLKWVFSLMPWYQLPCKDFKKFNSKTTAKRKPLSEPWWYNVNWVRAGFSKTF